MGERETILAGRRRVKALIDKCLESINCIHVKDGNNLAKIGYDSVQDKLLGSGLRGPVTSHDGKSWEWLGCRNTNQNAKGGLLFPSVRKMLGLQARA